ncbi:glycoside hydrolase family 18 protein [Mycena pura]|uniref:Glycoside hydrolase family 18 protein n=1 Tax=Mycena pura TaxID=153505 RepID=A0AAD6YUX3_9AGAR|nr:glycoside hydrolase family 18 protein [Mycena pura]
MARLGFLASIITALVALVVVQAAPSNTTLGERAEGLSPVARDILLSARAVPSTRWVAYFDRFVSSTSLPDPSLISGFNVFALAFVYSASLQDNAAVWAELDAGTRASIKAEYAAAGISLIVSAYGSGPVPTSGGDDPTAAANFIANYVKTNDLDGVDVDYEDFGALETAGTAVAWLSTFTRALRAQLPQGQFILTHAPVAPWFTPNRWPNNGYLGVDAAVGSLIDWYNVQFYNQGASEYTTCAGLLTASSSTWPESSVFQIAANGVPLNKIVIGKPAAGADATNGFMDPGTLSTCLAQAKAQGWSAGAMTWQYPDGNSAWVTQVRSGSFPVGAAPPGGGGGGTTTTKTGTTTPPGSTSTPSGGSCSGVAAWVSNQAFPAGSVVTFGGSLWTANQWNFDEQPGGAAGAWDKTATCNGALQPATATAAAASPKASKGVSAIVSSAKATVSEPAKATASAKASTLAKSTAA